MAAIGNMGPFELTRFQGSGKHNGVPTFTDKLPLTRGGLAGEDAIFGRVVSIDPADPRHFVKGIPSASYLPFGILVNEPIINYADPAMNDKYFEGRPATVITFGLVEMHDYDVTQKAPTHGSKIIANNETGMIGFVGSATAVPMGNTQIPGSVYEVLTPNGVRLWVNFNELDFTSTDLPTVITPVATPAAGTVAAGTIVKITSATPAAIIHFTLDGSDPTFDSPVFPVDGIAITAAVTITTVAVKEGMNPSAITPFAYTV